MTARITHAAVAGSAANPDVLVDGPKWDAEHEVTGVAALDGGNIFTGTQTINPTAGTLSQGFVVNQTLPSSGTFPGPIFGNVLTIINPGVTANDSGIDAFGQINAQVTGFRINYTSGGGGLNNIAFNAANWVTGQTDACGDVAGVATATNVSGHNLWGRIGYGILLPGGASRNLISLEGEVGIATGASAENMAALSANSQGPVLGSILTAALMVSTIDQLPGAAAPFPHLIALSKNLYSGGRFPIAATGDLIFSDAAGTIGDGINLPNVAVTGKILNFQTMAIGGNGTAVFGAPASGLPGAGINITGPFSGVVQIQGLPNSGNNGDGVTVLDSAGTNIAFFGVQEASTTATRFGQSASNFGQLVTLGSTSAGLMLGTVTSDPVIIGTNNIARMTLPAAGDVLVTGGLSVTTQFTSTAATGTAPLVVASTTLVANLHAATADALTTARTIDGQSFNGSANITVIAPGTHAATTKATPVDADELPLVDSAASNVLKKLTWANLKATLKAYFDTLYQATGTYIVSVKKQTFVAGGTYTPSAGMLYCIIESFGGGAAGGGAVSAAGHANNGGGGGSGGYSRVIATAAAVGASKIVTIGTGGAGVSAANGGNGSATSVGALCVANGGTGGGVGQFTLGGSGGPGGTAGTGDDTFIGTPGSLGIGMSSASGAGGSGNGGSMWGGGASGVSSGTAANGNAATGYGGGGSGGASFNAGGAATGGNGFAGYVRITEFCSQ